MAHLLSDEQVHRLITPTEAVAVMENVFRARAAGQTAGSPRWSQNFPQGSLTFTVGAVPEGVGFRAYVRGSFEHDDQLVAVWQRETGQLRGVVVGEAIGVLRTGAIGGVAAKYLAPGRILALIGTGRQAFSQLRAIATVRPLSEVRVYSRTPDHRQAFCEDVRQIMPLLNIYPAESAEAAVRGAQIIICATTSKTPVLRGEWLSPDAHVSTLGPKGTTQREVDTEVVRLANFVVTDSPEQAYAFPDGLIIDGTDKALHELSAVVTGQVKRPDRGISLFISTGLAGTEVALAARLMDKFERQGQAE